MGSFAHANRRPFRSLGPAREGPEEDPSMMTATLPTTRPGAAGHLSLDLPLSAWAQWRDVLVATREAGSVPVDAVVLGPTGVHVVVRSTAAAGSTPVETVLQVVE